MYLDRKSEEFKALWPQRRAEVLTRDGGRCVMCRTSEALTVHHRIPRRVSYDDSLRNLATLCVAHHRAVEALDEITEYMSWERAVFGRR